MNIISHFLIYSSVERQRAWIYQSGGTESSLIETTPTASLIKYNNSTVRIPKPRVGTSLDISNGDPKLLITISKENANNFNHRGNKRMNKSSREILDKVMLFGLREDNFWDLECSWARRPCEKVDGTLINNDFDYLNPVSQSLIALNYDETLPSIMSIGGRESFEIALRQELGC
jgi:hypothetical protein